MRVNPKAYLKKVLSRIHPLSSAALAAFILLSVTAVYGITPLDGEKELYCGVIRFHVLANSDSEKDQNLKLEVRDAVTEYTTVLLNECTDISDAKRLISDNREKIVSAAENVIVEKGFDYSVSLDEGYEIYPERNYGKYTFPAGRYYSVRLKIGEAKGKNWWCVMFPPMCLGSASTERFDDTDELCKAGFTEDGIKIITDSKSVKKEVRFFFLDLINKRK